MYICIYMYIYIYVYIIHVYICICICIYVYRYIMVYRYIGIHVCMNVYVYEYVMYMYMYMCMCMCMYMYMHMHMHIYFWHVSFPVQPGAQANILLRSCDLEGQGSLSLLLRSTFSWTILLRAPHLEHSAALPCRCMVCELCPSHIEGGSGPLLQTCPTNSSKVCSFDLAKM